MIKIAAPVYKYTSESNPTIMLIHKSPKGKPGIWQISYFLPGMSDQTATPLGDSEFPSLTHALLYAKKMGFNMVEKAGDEARVAALFGISVSKGIVNNYWDEYLCSQDSHCSHKKAEVKKQAAPVYKLKSEVVEEIYLIIHKSVQNPGWWQVTQFEKETNDPIEDKQFQTLQEAMEYAAEGEFEIVQKTGVEDEEKVEAEQEKEAIDSAGTTWVDRNEPGGPTERGEITQLEHGKDTSKNRTQQR